MFCYLPDWADFLIFVGGVAALFISRHRLIERTEQRVHRQRDEMNAWNKMTPEEQADSIIYGEHDVRPRKGGKREAVEEIDDRSSSLC
jgi:predicted Fe-S protein YdhL (DUF1289 family)